MDNYELWMEEQEKIYGPVRNRDEILDGMKDLVTEEQLGLWFVFPLHTDAHIPREEAGRRARAIGIERFEELLDGLLENFWVLSSAGEDGRALYARSYLFMLMMTYADVLPDHPFTMASRRWFNYLTEGDILNMPEAHPHARFIPQEEYLPKEGMIKVSKASAPLDVMTVDMDEEIPEQREVVPYDLATEILRNAKLIAVVPCMCRQNKEALGIRECDYPIDTCLELDDMAEQSASYGGKVLTLDEALALTKRNRELGLVHMTSNARHPCILCSCCPCCCLALASLRHGFASSAKPSRFRPRMKRGGRCIQCGACVRSCPMKALTIGVNGTLVVNLKKCIGCGLCLRKCPTGCKELVLRSDSDKLLPDYEITEYLLL